jgi:hypothetical protein
MSGILEVKIVAEFTTGTTVEDKEQAQELVKKMFLKGLAKDGFAEENGGSVFSVKIVEVKAEPV